MSGPRMTRGISGWREWSAREARADLRRRTDAAEIDRRHMWGRYDPERWRAGERGHPYDEDMGPGYGRSRGGPSWPEGGSSGRGFGAEEGGWREGESEGWGDREPRSFRRFEVEGGYGEGRFGAGRYGEGTYEGRYGESGYGEGRYGEGRYGEGRYGEGRYGEGRYGEGRYGEDRYGEGRFGRGRYGESGYGEGRYSEGGYGEGGYGESGFGEGGRFRGGEFEGFGEEDNQPRTMREGFSQRRRRRPEGWGSWSGEEGRHPNRGFGGYGSGGYGGSYGGIGPGPAGRTPPAGSPGGLSGTGSPSGGFGLRSGWEPERMGIRGAEPGERRRPRGWEDEGPLVGDLMTRDPQVVGPDASVRDAARVMREEDAGIVPVVLDGRVLGVITDRDLTIRVIAEGRDASSVKCREVMTEDVETCSPKDRLVDVVRIMGEDQLRRMPVVGRDDRIQGIISMTDIAREAELDYALQEALEQIASRRSFWSKW